MELRLNQQFYQRNKEQSLVSEDFNRLGVEDCRKQVQDQTGRHIDRRHRKNVKMATTTINVDQMSATAGGEL